MSIVDIVPARKGRQGMKGETRRNRRSRKECKLSGLTSSSIQTERMKNEGQLNRKRE